jgi:hypothetical protein
MFALVWGGGWDGGVCRFCARSLIFDRVGYFLAKRVRAGNPTIHPLKYFPPVQFSFTFYANFYAAQHNLDGFLLFAKWTTKTQHVFCS